MRGLLLILLACCLWLTIATRWTVEHVTDAGTVVARHPLILLLLATLALAAAVAGTRVWVEKEAVIASPSGGVFP